MIIKISLLLVFASLPVFLLVELLQWLSVQGLPDILAQLGAAILLSAFALLVVTGILSLFKKIIGSIFDYFSSMQRVQRRLLYSQTKQDQIKRLFYFRKLQIKYFSDLKRKSLLKINNHKHIQSLSKANHKNLLAIKKQLPGTTFKQLQQENARYREQQDVEALLKFQQKISALE
ncbi:MAG: hypothetical protein PHY16_03000 [Methylobacter sp.]|nr:hypothetical protein [Methylobacter sp.]